MCAAGPDSQGLVSTAYPRGAAPPPPCPWDPKPQPPFKPHGKWHCYDFLVPRDPTSAGVCAADPDSQGLASTAYPSGAGCAQGCVTGAVKASGTQMGATKPRGGVLKPRGVVFCMAEGGVV